MNHMSRMFYLATFVLITILAPASPTPQIGDPCGLRNNKGIYVKEGTVINCTCEDPDATAVSWESDKNGILLNSSSNSAVLVLNLTRQYDGDNIYCKSDNGTTKETEGDFSVLVAYGPDSVSLVIGQGSGQGSTQVDVCMMCNTVTVTCKSQNVSLGVTTNIYGNGSNVVLYSSLLVTEYAIPTSTPGGPLSITCTSRNSLFPDLMATKSSTIVVRVPPVSPPLITIDGRDNTTATVIEGLHTITCRVDGGYPQVDNVIVQCGNLLNISSQGKTLTSTENFTPDFNGVTCSCWASHVTGYYQQITSVTLDVQWPPALAPVMTIDGRNGSAVTVTAGVHSIRCQVDGGNPPVDNVIVQCGNLLNISSQGNTLTSTENFTPDFNGVTCSCWASHVTGYYQLKKYVTLDVQYAPIVNSFTFNGLSGSQNVSSGTHVNFYCSSEGNPKPIITIATSTEYKILKTGFSPLNFPTEMTCSDTATYICQANSSLSESLPQSINVNILCDPAPPPPLPLVAIIVGVIVPVVVLAIVALVAVIIYRKRSQKPETTTSELTSGHSSSCDTTRPSESHLSGSFDQLNTNNYNPIHKYETFQPGQTSEHISNRDYENLTSPGTSSNVTPATRRHAKTQSELSGVEIIPVITDTACGGEMQNAQTEIPVSAPPILPEKSRHKKKLVRLSRKDSNPYDTLPVRDQNRTPVFDGTPIPPIPKPGSVNLQLRPRKPTEES